MTLGKQPILFPENLSVFRGGAKGKIEIRIIASDHTLPS